jgi:hypothetical protein
MAAPGSSEEAKNLFAEVLQANGLYAGSQLSNVTLLQLYGVNLPKVRHTPWVLHTHSCLSRCELCAVPVDTTQLCSLAPFTALQTLHIGQQRLSVVRGLDACASLEVRAMFGVDRTLKTRLVTRGLGAYSNNRLSGSPTAKYQISQELLACYACVS